MGQVMCYYVSEQKLQDIIIQLFSNLDRLKFIN